MATPQQKKFITALQNWIEAGNDLVAEWDQEDGETRFNADEEAPLPPNLAPPMSLSDWFPELEGHYLSYFHICIGCGEDLHEVDGEANMCLNPKCMYFHDMSGRGMGQPEYFADSEPHGGPGGHEHNDLEGRVWAHSHGKGVHGVLVRREVLP